ncbi:MAG: peptidase [Planctomycetaceae bacterium]|nr:peptidase [Planctomycetaceae bacterium]
MVPLIDGHLDLAWNALAWNRDLRESVEELRSREVDLHDDKARTHATVSLPEMRRGGVMACLGTVLARSKPAVRPVQRVSIDYVDQTIASAVARGQLAYYHVLADAGHVRMINTGQEFAAHCAAWQRNADAPLGVVVAMEGADPIISPDDAQGWWDAGLRVVGLAHYGPSAYAMGTVSASSEDSIANPSMTADDWVDGITDAGRALLAEFERLGMIVDATHLSDRCLDELLDGFGGTILASHCNCRGLVDRQRQLPDHHLRGLIDRGSVIGAALDAWMLDASWVLGGENDGLLRLASVADHMDYVCQLAGNTRHSGIGSDLDGGFGTEQSPRDLDTIADLQKLGGLLRDKGYNDEDVAAIFHGNWLRLLSESLPD